MPLASPSPLSTHIAALLSSFYVYELYYEGIQIQTEQLKLTRAGCLLKPCASLQLTAAIKKPARTKFLHANLTQRRDQAPAPLAGGDLALTLRRSVRRRCVCCAMQIAPRAFWFMR